MWLSYSNEPWMVNGFTHENTHITHICVHNHIKCTHVEKEFPPASALKPELPVLLNPILKEHFTPHVWEAPGIGRECTRSDIYTNTICMPDAMFYHRSKPTHLGTRNIVAACLLLLVKHCFNNCSYLLYKPMGRKVLLWNCCTAQLLFKYCIIQLFPHFPSSCSSKKYIWQQRLSRWRPI